MACPCHHCGSPMHYDNNHPFKNPCKRAQANTTLTMEDALETYYVSQQSSGESSLEDSLSTIKEEEDPIAISDDEDFPSSPE
jgi:homoserine acetyltransferase